MFKRKVSKGRIGWCCMDCGKPVSVLAFRCKKCHLKWIKKSSYLAIGSELVKKHRAIVFRG